MAEKIKIFELDIDVDGAISASKELKSESTQLKERLDNLKDAGKENSKEFVELEARYKSVRKEYNSSQRELGKMINLQGKNIKTIEQGRNALSVVSKEWAKQADLYGENSDAAQKLTKKKTELTERLKVLEKQTGDNRRNVGNYSEGVKEALGIDQAYTQATQKLTIAKKAYTLAVGKSTGAMKLFRLALASTGIGLLVIALGSLIAYFASTQEGINKIRKVLIPLKTIAQSLFGVFQNIGKAMVDAFSNPKQTIKDLWETIKTNLINRVEGLGLAFKAIGKIISSGFTDGYGDLGEAIAQTTTGVEDLAGKVKKAVGDAGQFFTEAAQRGAELERIQQRLNANEDDFIRKQAVLKREFEEQKKLAEDTTKSQQVRETAAAKAIESQEKLRDLTVNRLEQEARLIELKQQSNDTSDADNAELARKMAEIDAAIAEEAAKTTEAQNKLNSIRKEGYQAAQKAAEENKKAAQEATEAAIAESKIRLQIFVEEQKGKADTLDEEIKLQENVRDKKLEILEDELKAKKLSQSEYELAVLQTKNEFLDQQAQLTEQYAQKEIEAEKERLAKRQELEDLEKERKVTDLENKREIEAENFEAQLEIEKQRLEMQRQQELAEAEKTGADKALINQKYAEIDKDIEAEKAQYKRDVASETFANLATILGKETAAGKAAAVAQTTIDTYSAATAAYKAMAGIPVVGPALGAIAAAAAVASGLQTVRKITSTKEPEIPNASEAPRAAKGMTLKGPSHSGGGINLYDDSGTPVVNAEGDENVYVINKRASGLINSLSYMNEATGGIPLSRSTRYAAAGGMISKGGAMGKTKNQSLDIDYETMARMNAEAMRNVKIFTAVTDINTGQRNYAEVVNGANV